MSVEEILGETLRTRGGEVGTAAKTLTDKAGIDGSAEPYTEETVITDAAALAYALAKWLMSVDGQFAKPLDDAGRPEMPGCAVLRYCSAACGAMLGQLTAETYNMLPFLQVVNPRNPMGSVGILCGYASAMKQQGLSMGDGAYSKYLSKYSAFSPHNQLLNGGESSMCSTAIRYDARAIALLSVSCEHNRF